MPFHLNGPSTLWICIAGGDQVSFANLAMTLTDGPATSHFGTFPIHGVVLHDRDVH